MRRIFLAVLIVACAVPGLAQGRVYPAKKAFFTVGYSLGTALGGQLGGTTLMQAGRASATFNISGTHGIGISATRLQSIIPSRGLGTDYEYGNPEGDALVVSYASLQPSRARGIPSVFSLGGGVIRRNTSEAGRTRDTWVAKIGFDSDPFARWSHADAGVGFQSFLMPTNTRSLLYVATLGLFFRIG